MTTTCLLEPTTLPVYEPVVDTKPTRLEVLRQLRRVCEEAPEELFAMETWSQKFFGCGTAYCLAGWARLDSWMQRNTLICKAIDLLLPSGHMSTDKSPIDFRDVFHISDDDARNLFSYDGWSNIPKSLVLANIDRIIAGQPAVPYYEERYSAGGRLMIDLLNQSRAEHDAEIAALKFQREIDALPDIFTLRLGHESPAARALDFLDDPSFADDIAAAFGDQAERYCAICDRFLPCSGLHMCVPCALEATPIKAEAPLEGVELASTRRDF